MRDIINNIDEDILTYAKKWFWHMDQVWATNLIIWTQLHGIHSIDQLKKRGFLNDAITFAAEGDRLSSWVKRFSQTATLTKVKYSELNSLVGYLTSDLVPTDWKEKVDALAHGGNPHGLVGEDWEYVFKASNQDIKIPSSHYIKPSFIDFFSYLQSGQWITGGSSSIGNVEWEVADEHGSFRARKNMLQYLYSTEELYSMCIEWDGITHNRGFIKDELAKRRLAVSSSLQSYLLDAYFLRLYGHPYKGWKYVTLDESSGTAHNRTAEISTKLSQGCYALPFDFKQFDHQATTDEIIWMIESNLAEVAVPPGNQDEWDAISLLILKGYKNATISMFIDNKKYTDNVTGGLPSGVRMTSLIGNQWNAIVTNIVIDRAVQMSQAEIPLVGVRGDDVYIVHQSPIFLAIVRDVYKAVNAIGHDAKFGICHSICEFLRNEISPDGSLGWSNRSIPSLTQRKPWNPQPWGVSHQVRTTADNIRTLERRIFGECNFLHQSNKVKWSKYFKQSYKWLELPTRLGGFGVYPDKGWRPGRKLSLPIAKSVTFKGLKPNPPRWVSMTTQQNEKYSSIQMNRLLAMDDIAYASKHTNAGQLEYMRTFKTVWTVQKVFHDHAYGVHTPQPRSTVRWEASYSPRLEFNHGISFLEVLSTANSVAQAMDTTVGSIMAKLFPRTWYIIQRYERTGWHRSDAINLAIGVYPTSTLFKIHPILTVFVANACKLSMEGIYKRTDVNKALYAYTESAEKQMVEQGALRTYAY